MISLTYLLRFLEEDAPFGDVTSEAVIPEDLEAEAVIIAKQDGIIAGLEEAKALFEHFDVKVELKAKDGDEVKKGDVVIELRGDRKSVV